MDKLQELREQLAKALAEARALVYDGDKRKENVGEEDVKKADDLLARADELKAEIKGLEAEENRFSRLDTGLADLDRDRGRQAPAGSDPDVTPAVARAAQAGGVMYLPSGDPIPNIRVMPRFGRLRAFRSGNLNVDLEDAYSAGMFYRAALLGDEESARWCRERGYADVRAQTGTTLEGGGATIPTPLSNRIIDLVEEFGVIRREANIMPMSSDTLPIVRRTGGVTAYFTGDPDATTQSEMTLDRINLVAKELSSLSLVPISLAADSIINFGDRIALEQARAFADKEDDCGFNGDGTSTYGGIVGIRTKMIDGNHAGSYDDATAGDDTWPAYILSDLLGLTGKTPAYPGMNEKWFCSKIAWAQTLQRLAAGQGGSTGAELTNGLAKQFLGFDVALSQKMPKVTTALDEVVVFLFGDLSMAVTMGVRAELTVRVSDQRYFEYRQIGILSSERFDINVHDIGSASAAGPLVGLRGNTS